MRYPLHAGAGEKFLKVGENIMTKLYEVKIKCPVCKSKFKGFEYASVHFWHKPLLDGCRVESPSPTMCPSCGYVSYDFRKKSKVKLKDLQNDSYKTCDGLIEKLNFDEYDIAEYRNYILAKIDNNYKKMYCSLRKCMHLYGKELRAELLPEVYVLFCKVYEDELEKEDKATIAIQLFYLRLLGKFQEAKEILESVEYEDLVVPENWRLLFESEMIEAHNSEVQDGDDYFSWELLYWIKIYGAEFDRRFRAVVGEEVPLMYYDEIAGESWVLSALHYAKSIGMEGNNKASSFFLAGRVLANQQYHQIYKMKEDDLDEVTRGIFSAIREYYAKKLRARSY